MNLELAQWLLGLAMLVLGVFLKSLHRKIDNSVSREEFNAAMKSMREDHERDRRELRDSMIKFETQMQSQNDLLIRLTTKMEILTNMRPFDKTFPGK